MVLLPAVNKVRHASVKEGMSPRFIGIFLLLTALTPAVCAELRMVTKDDARLYKDNQLKAVLDKGRIVDTADHPTNNDWLKVRHEGNVYDARRSEMMPEWKLGRHMYITAQHQG